MYNLLDFQNKPDFQTLYGTIGNAAREKADHGRTRVEKTKRHKSSLRGARETSRKRAAQDEFSNERAESSASQAAEIIIPRFSLGGKQLTHTFKYDQKRARN